MIEESPARSHPHPCRFRMHGYRDRGWGELAFEYRWEPTQKNQADEKPGIEELTYCYIYEVTEYGENEGRFIKGWFYPPAPPFIAWQFRHPTDGRTAPVGMEYFPATQGWAWDRHKLGGKLAIPPKELRTYTIRAVQQYWFYCELCNQDFPLSKPQEILRSFATICSDVSLNPTDSPDMIWRYSLTKHDVTAWMEINRNGYVADSANIGFGPF